jgi:hypothetical protein
LYNTGCTSKDEDETGGGGGQDKDSVVGTIVEAPALLDPRADLLQEKSKINDKLVSSKKGEAGNGV